MRSALLVSLLGVLTLARAAAPEYATDRGSKSLGGTIGITQYFDARTYGTSPASNYSIFDLSLSPDVSCFIAPGIEIGAALNMGYNSDKFNPNQPPYNGFSLSVTPRIRAYSGGRNATALPFAEIGLGYGGDWQTAELYSRSAGTFVIPARVGVVYLLRRHFGVEMGLEAIYTMTNSSTTQGLATSIPVKAWDSGVDAEVYAGVKTFLF